MCSATIKHTVIIISFGFAMLASASLCSCGGDDNKDARNLLNQAETAFNNGEFDRTLSLTDSIKSAYPKAIEVRREALHLATRATEGLTLIRLQEADSLTAVLGALGDSLGRKMKFVKNPIEGYYVASTTEPSKFIGTNGLQARVSPEGDFYMLSSLKAKSVKSTSVTVSNGTDEARTSIVAYDGERNDRSRGGEVITFIGAECDSVGKFISSNVNSPLTLTFNGSTSYSMSLPTAQAKEIALVYDYASTLRRFKVASLEKERLSRALDIARSQAARTFIEKDSIQD